MAACTTCGFVCIHSRVVIIYIIMIAIPWGCPLSEVERCLFLRGSKCTTVEPPKTAPRITEISTMQTNGCGPESFPIVYCT